MSEQYKELAMRILSKDFIKLSTRNFVSNIMKSFEDYGAISEKQSEALLKVAQEHGIDLAKTSNGAKIEFKEMKGSCGLCDAGIVIAKSKNNKNSYAFKCRCHLGSQRLEQYAIFTSESEHFYEIH